MDMSYDKDSDERDQTSKKYDENNYSGYRSLETRKIEFAEKYRQY